MVKDEYEDPDPVPKDSPPAIDKIYRKLEDETDQELYTLEKEMKAQHLRFEIARSKSGETGDRIIYLD